MYDVAIIGCGVIGAATAYLLSQYDISVVVLEKQNDVAMGTTKANSAILHAGYDPEPHTQMAKLNVRGNALAKEWCKKLDVPMQECGSLVLAFDAADCKHLETLYARGTASDVPGLKLLSAQEVRAMQPNVSPEVQGALYAPSAAIVNPWEYALAMAQTAVTNGVTLLRNAAVTSIEPHADFYTITCNNTTVQARFVVNAAGVHAQEVHAMVAEPSFTMMPNKGQYYLLDKSEGTRISQVVFQCPTALGKGVLVAPTVHGNLIVGPDATDCAPDDTATTATSLENVAALAKKSVPSVDLRACIRTFAGVRANTDHDAFILESAPQSPHFISLAGIKSPGLTAAPAIAETALDLLRAQGLVLTQKNSFTDTRTVVRFHALSPSEKAALVAKEPAYGRVICRCETITEGEILAAIQAPIPPCSVDGVKRRAGAGMGRCQGGFCAPRVVEILAKALGVPPTAIMQDGADSYLLTHETKQGGADHV